jgi:hypothetical protein
MRIASSRNVGIGTVSPTGKLEVVGGRSFFSAASEAFGVGVKHVSTGGAVYFGATDGTATPNVQISNSGGLALMTLQNGGNVGIGTASPAPSAKLEIAGTTGALLVPRLTTTERNALTAVNGMIIYNATDNQMQGRINGAWVAM